MQTLEALKKRRSIRAFNARPVPRNIIEEIVDCARLAPTARNIQPWEFIVITEKDTLKKLGSLADNTSLITGCGCCIAVFCRETKYYLEDGCAATTNILNAAFDLGLCGCWVAGDKKPYSDEVRQLLKAPEDFKLISLIALGYSDTNPALPSKRLLNEVMHWQTYASTG